MINLITSVTVWAFLLAPSPGAGSVVAPVQVGPFKTKEICEEVRDKISPSMGRGFSTAWTTVCYPIVGGK